MLRVPRGVKHISLWWVVFAPYFIWVFGHLAFDGLPLPLRWIGVIFLAYLVVGSVVTTTIWTRISRSIPPDEPNQLPLAWGIGASACIMVLFAILFTAGDAWKDKSARAFIDQRLPPILSVNSEEAPNKSASADPSLRGLGRLLVYEGSEGHARRVVRPEQADVVAGSYVARARFEHGNAQISVEVLREHGQWQLTSFHVEASAPSR